jgi:D-alanyl-D-alanine carboxypeptidase
MKLKTTMAVVTTCTLLTTGCSFNNPFTDDKKEQTGEHQKPSGSETENGTESDNNQHDTDGNKQQGEKGEAETGQSDLPSPEETVEVTGDGTKVVTNVNDTLVLVNKRRNLPSTYIPQNLVVPDVPFPFTEDLPKKQMQQVAATALEKLFAQAEQDNIPLFAQSGYRSYARQEAIFASNVNKMGEEEASRVSAHPGQSEHQTGLAMDVTSPAVGYQLIERFGETEAGIWLKEHAHEFGFIIRYPQGQEAITGYSYEPWHLRYVGKEHATNIHEQNVTLEEYMGVEVEAVDSSQ